MIRLLALNIVNFFNFEIRASLLSEPPSNKHHTKEFQNLKSAGGAY